MSRVSAELVTPKTNIKPKPIDDDHDGKPDYGITRELSEDVNAQHVKRGNGKLFGGI